MDRKSRCKMDIHIFSDSDRKLCTNALKNLICFGNIDILYEHVFIKQFFRDVHLKSIGVKQDRIETNVDRKRSISIYGERWATARHGAARFLDGRWTAERLFDW